MKRLLTKNEIVKEASKDRTYCQLSVDMGMWASKAQDSKTLKAVGKWLQDLWDTYGSYDVTAEDVKALLRGEMPEKL